MDLFHTGHEVLASRINADGLMLDGKQKIAEDAGKMLFPEGFFDEGVYIVENSQTNRVSLLDPKGREYVTVSSDAPLYGIWSPEKKNAPFVAIEPWYGRCDRATFAGTLEEREWGNHLMPHETFERSYEIAIHRIEDQIKRAVSAALCGRGRLFCHCLMFFLQFIVQGKGIPGDVIRCENRF